MEELFELFEKSEDVRHQSAIESNREFFEPERSRNYYKFHHELFIKKLETFKFGETSKSGENLEAIQKYDLTNDDASAVYMYTHHHIYGNLNYNLRHGAKLYPDDLKYIELINVAFDKIPPYNSKILYRDIRKPEDGFEKWLDYYASKVGEEIVFNDFLSFHTDDVRISDEEEEYQFVIQTSTNSNSRNIQELTFVNNENEVLFRNGTKFIIDKVVRDENRIYMTELS